jgi:hypothetical protein
MIFKKLFLFVLICTFMAPTNVFADKGKWSFTPYLGVNAATSREMVESKTSTAGAQTFSGGSSFDGTLSISTRKLDFDDTHNARILTGFEIGYFLTKDLEVFGGYQSVTAGGNKIVAVDIAAAGTFTNSGGTATAISLGDTADIEFDNYNSWSIKVGATKYLPLGDYIPYVGGYFGLKHVDKMDITLTFAGAGNLKTNFYDSTNIGFFGLHTGVYRDFTAGSIPLLIGVRTRLDYTPELIGNDTDTELIGLGVSNDVGGGMDLGLTAHVLLTF